MAENAYSHIYKDEWIRGFERRQAKLRGTVTTEAMIEGKSATFLIGKSNRSAVTRGPNGLIPAAVDDLNQVTVTLKEIHDLPQKTRFNIFTGQSNQREILQTQSREVINRAIDDEIIATLNTGTIDVNTTPTVMGQPLVNKALSIFGNANVPTDDGMINCALTDPAWGQMMLIDSFASSDYVSGRPMEDGFVEMRRWMGITWLKHNALPGVGTSDAVCPMWHKSAVGHAYASEDVQALAGYNEEQDYSWARTTIYHGSLLIQNAGVVHLHIDDTAI